MFQRLKIANYIIAASMGGLLIACGESNRPPEVVSEIIRVEFNNSIEFSLKARDPEGKALTFNLTQQPTSGSLVSIDVTSQRYRYTPDSESITSDHLAFEVSDGKKTASGSLTFDVVDNSIPEVTDYSPQNEAPRVEVGSAISVSFDDIMMQMKHDANNSECHGAVRLSADDFATCVVFSSVTLTQGGHAVELVPANPLESDTTYQIKLTADAQNFHQVAAIESTIGSFTTASSDLRITEISDSKYWDDNRWIEVYNGTANTLDLADYALRSDSINLDDFSDSGIQIFAFPSLQVASGEYVVVQGRFGNGYWQSSVAESTQLVLIGSAEDNIRPEWYADGFVELLNSAGTQTIDFVRYGDNMQAPADAAQWLSEDSAPVMNYELGMSLVRSVSRADTNQSSDWGYSSFITPGGDNDIDCAIDDDLDGIPDCAEVEGATFAGLPLYEWGAREGIKDIFIEVDYMESEDAGVTPHKAALQKVVDVFASHGYAIHFDVGDLYHQQEGLSPADFDLGGGNQVSYYAQTTFTSSELAPSILDHKVNNFDIKRRPVFHYMLMANSQLEDGSGGSSGVAELWGNDLLISIGNWGLTMETEAASNTTVNFQSSTIMHELGHNLGLLHGGNDNFNYKPNHLSIMNYMYQLQGLPTIGEREGDRYYRSFHRNNMNCNLENNELLYGFTASPVDFQMDYSSGLAQSMNEASIDEIFGLGADESIAVDFNCNADDSETLVDYDVNGNGSAADVLNDADEWSLVVMDFSRFWNGSVSGSLSKPDSKQKTRDIQNNDQQQLIQETAPSAEFFKTIRDLSSNAQ